MDGRPPRKFRAAMQKETMEKPPLFAFGLENTIRWLWFDSTFYHQICVKYIFTHGAHLQTWDLIYPGNKMRLRRPEGGGMDYNTLQSRWGGEHIVLNVCLCKTIWRSLNNMNHVPALWIGAVHTNVLLFHSAVQIHEALEKVLLCAFGVSFSPWKFMPP